MTEPREDDLRAAFASLHAPTSASRYADRVAATGAGGWTWRLPRRTSALVAIGTAAVVALGTVTTLELRGSPSHRSPVALGASASASATASTDYPSPTPTDAPTAAPTATPTPRPTTTQLRFSGAWSGTLRVSSVNCDVDTVAGQGIMDAYGRLADNSIHDILLYSNARTSVTQIQVREMAGVVFSQTGSAGVTAFDWRAGATVHVQVPRVSGGQALKVDGTVVCPAAPSPLPTPPATTELTFGGVLSGSLSDISVSCLTNIVEGPSGFMTVSGWLPDGTRHFVSVSSNGDYSPDEVAEGHAGWGRDGDFYNFGNPVAGVTDFDWSLGAVIHVTMQSSGGAYPQGSTLRIDGTIRCATGTPPPPPPPSPRPTAPPTTEIYFSGALSGPLSNPSVQCGGGLIRVTGNGPDGLYRAVMIESDSEWAPYEIDEGRAEVTAPQYYEQGRPPAGVTGFDASLGATIHATLQDDPGGYAAPGTTLTIDGTVRC